MKACPKFKNLEEVCNRAFGREPDGPEMLNALGKKERKKAGRLNSEMP